MPPSQNDTPRAASDRCGECGKPKCHWFLDKCEGDKEHIDTHCHGHQPSANCPICDKPKCCESITIDGIVHQDTTFCHGHQPSAGKCGTCHGSKQLMMPDNYSIPCPDCAPASELTCATCKKPITEGTARSVGRNSYHADCDYPQRTEVEKAWAESPYAKAECGTCNNKKKGNCLDCHPQRFVAEAMASQCRKDGAGYCRTHTMKMDDYNFCIRGLTETLATASARCDEPVPTYTEDDLVLDGPDYKIDDLLPHATAVAEGDWEERFDKEICETWYDQNGIPVTKWLKPPDKIKSFISELLARERAASDARVARVREAVLECSFCGSHEAVDWILNASADEPK